MEPERLTEIPVFSELTAEEHAELAPALREVSVEAGTELAAQGTNAYELFVIRAGEAEVHKDGELIRSMGPGDVFGEIGLMSTGTRTASVVASTPMQLVAMFVREFQQVERRAPGLARSLRETMAERAARTGF